MPKKTSSKTPAKVVAKTPAPVAKKTVKPARTEPLSLSSYIVKVSKSANDGVGVRKNVKERIDELLLSFIRLVNKHAEENLKSRKTLQERDIEHSIRVFFPEGKLQTSLLERADKVLETFVSTKKTEGLDMSRPRTHSWLVWGLSDKENLHVSRNAVAYLTGALDQFVIEITREANIYSKEKERNNITLPDFEKAVKKSDWIKSVLVVLDGVQKVEIVPEKVIVEVTEAPPVVLKKVVKRPPLKSEVAKKTITKKTINA